MIDLSSIDVSAFPHWLSPGGEVLLINADCMAVLPLLPKLDAVVTDPPYGHGYRSNTACLNHKGKWRPTRSVCEMQWNNKPFDPSPWLDFSEVILWGANHYASKLPDSAAWLVWDKRDGNGENNLSDCELAWRSKGGSARLIRYLWMGLCRQAEIGEHYHPTQKPIAVMEWCIGWLPDDCRTILDPFAGSFTTAVACIRTGRQCIAIEIDPKYYAIGKRRCEEAVAIGSLFDPVAMAAPNLFEETQ